MSGIIPGGRQRASSEGDILDDDEEENEINKELSLSYSRHGISKSLQFGLTSGFESLKGNDSFESGSEVSSTSFVRKKKKKSKPSFKAVKNFVARLMTRPNSSVPGKSELLVREKQSSDKPDDHLCINKDLESTMKVEKDNQRNEQLDSSSRPLITNDTGTGTSFSYPRWDKTPGCVGIENHGNTCFMNAVLQCLSNIDSFSEYFINDLYKGALKTSTGNAKKFGTQGEVTGKLAILLKSIWVNDYHTDVSNDFKSVVGKYNGQYKGSDQHDAQEFLLWLLDHVHEDLNIASGKRTKQAKDSLHKTDEDQATEVLLSNSGSFVYELFQALYRSSLTCPDCKKHSNTFDPYLCLSLPLPLKSLRPVYVTIVYLTGSPKQVKVGLQLNTYDTVRDLRYQLATNSKIIEERLVLCQIYDDGFRATYSDNQPLSDIHESETVYAIEMLPARSPEQELPQYNMCVSYIQIILVHVEILSNPSKCYRFCSPHVIRVPRDVTYKHLQHEILKGLGSSVQNGILSQSQRMSVVFRLRIINALSGKCYLPTDVEMPLYTQTIDQVLSSFDKELGPIHLQLVAEWECNTKNQIIIDDDDDIHEHNSVHQARLTQQQSSPVHLDECFKLFTQEEKLNGEDAWKCPHCNRERQGTTKTLGIWSLPEILVIHLKRFKQVGLRRNKLNTLVRFPISDYNMGQHLVKNSSKSETSQQKLDSRLKRDDVTYDLIAVCNHYGNMHGGHYTAFCKNPADGCWYKFDDKKVDALLSDEIVTKAAYLLFYQRRTITKKCMQVLQNRTHWSFTLPVTRSTSTASKLTKRRESPKPSRKVPRSPLVHRDHSHAQANRIPQKPQRTERYHTSHVNGHKELSGDSNGLPNDNSGIHVEQLRVSLPPAGAVKPKSNSPEKTLSPSSSVSTSPPPLTDQASGERSTSRQEQRLSNVSTKSSTSQSRPLVSSWPNSTEHGSNVSHELKTIDDPTDTDSSNVNETHRNSSTTRANSAIPTPNIPSVHSSNGRSTHQVIHSRPIIESTNQYPSHKSSPAKIAESKVEDRTHQHDANSPVGLYTSNNVSSVVSTYSTGIHPDQYSKQNTDINENDVMTTNRTKQKMDNRTSLYDRSLDSESSFQLARNHEKRQSRVGRSSSSSRVDNRHHTKERSSANNNCVPPRPVTQLDLKVHSETAQTDSLVVYSHQTNSRHSRSEMNEKIRSNKFDAHEESATSIKSNFDNRRDKTDFQDNSFIRGNKFDNSFHGSTERWDNHRKSRAEMTKPHDSVDAAAVQSRPLSSHDERAYRTDLPRRNLHDEFTKYATIDRSERTNMSHHIYEDRSYIGIPKSKTDYSINSSGSKTTPVTPVSVRRSDGLSINNTDCYHRYQPQIHIPQYISKSLTHGNITPGQTGIESCLKESSV